MAKIDIVDALDRLSSATKTYIDETNFSGDYNDLENKPEIPVVQCATASEVQNELSSIFNR